MESLPSTPVYVFTPETLVEIRRSYNLDGPGRMDEAIELLEDWIKKQNHFVKKDFSRDYLERCIIFCKGSVEKAKKNMDSMCTLRSLIPHMYGDYDFRNDLKFKNVFDLGDAVILPKLTADHHRVLILKCKIQQANKQVVSDFFRYTIALCEYWRAHDYSNGFIHISDLRDSSISEFIASLDLIEARKLATMYIDGYKARVKGIHVLTTSTMVHMLIKIIKQIVSPKIRDRFHVHGTVEELYEVVPKDILPEEYGGKEKSTKQLQDDWIEELSSKQHKEFMQEMKKAVTNENYRLKDKFSDDITEMLGSFRSLNVD